MLYVKKYPLNRRNSEGCKTSMVLWMHRCPHLRAALPWEATVVPSWWHWHISGQAPVSQGTGTVAVWPNPLNTPPFQCYQPGRGSSEVMLSCLYKQNHTCTTTRSRATISMSFTAVRALRACKLATVTQAKIF